MRGNPDSASLTGSLLARKGSAAPSKAFGKLFEAFPGRPQQLTQREPIDEAVCNDNIALLKGPGLCDGLHAAQSASAVRSGRGGERGNARAKLSVRLDSERHLRLKLSAAHLGRSSQAIMLEALDTYLANLAPSLAKNCMCLKRDD